MALLRYRKTILNVRLVLLSAELLKKVRLISREAKVSREAKGRWDAGTLYI